MYWSDAEVAFHAPQMLYGFRAVMAAEGDGQCAPVADDASPSLVDVSFEVKLAHVFCVEHQLIFKSSLSRGHKLSKRVARV